MHPLRVQTTFFELLPAKIFLILSCSMLDLNSYAMHTCLMVPGPRFPSSGPLLAVFLPVRPWPLATPFQHSLQGSSPAPAPP